MSLGFGDAATPIRGHLAGIIRGSELIKNAAEDIVGLVDSLRAHGYVDDVTKLETLLYEVAEMSKHVTKELRQYKRHLLMGE